MDKPAYKSIKHAQRLLDKDRESIQAHRLKRIGFIDGSIEPRGGRGGTGGLRVAS